MRMRGCNKCPSRRSEPRGERSRRSIPATIGVIPSRCRIVSVSCREDFKRRSFHGNEGRGFALVLDLSVREDQRGILSVGISRPYGRQRCKIAGRGGIKVDNLLPFKGLAPQPAYYPLLIVALQPYLFFPGQMSSLRRALSFRNLLAPVPLTRAPREPARLSVEAAENPRIPHFRPVPRPFYVHQETL